MVAVNGRAEFFRKAIARFIEERREAKLKGADDEAAGAAATKYEYTTWLADAAKRVVWIQAVTHVLKATHPDARGSSLHAAPRTLPAHVEIGSHSLGDDYADDIVGNAAALDVYKFLKVEVDGRRLLDWMQRDDADLLAALHRDEVVAREWVVAFQGLIRPAQALVSHEMAKQVYWCVSGEPIDDSGYQLLQPMFSSSLEHVIHKDINESFWMEPNKSARKAKWDKKASTEVFKEYRNSVGRKLGGSNKQNVSQLNSERHGVNYLLASLPPIWDQQPTKFLQIETAFQRFAIYEGVHELVKTLCDLLESNPPPTMETRIARERIERALGQSLAAFGLAIRQIHEPGWTRDDDCKLPLCEKIWLDPERAELPVREEHDDEDRAFIEALEWKDWPDEVAHRFGNWLNAILLKRGLPVGDAEHAHWAKQAIVDAEWPAPMQRRALKQTVDREVAHG